MARTGPSMHELIRRRRRARFIGRHHELAAFRRNFDLPPDDDRHRFLFYVHGPAGVGKTRLVREMEQLARDRGALTAYVDESVSTVPEALTQLGAEFARQGHPMKTLDRRLAAYRQKRHEAESISLRDVLPDQATGTPTAPAGPSPAALAVARAGIIGLGMVPVVGAFAGMLDAAELAQGTGRLRAALSARFANQDDVHLVLAPDRVLTPVLADELSGLDAPWIVLFFDTYERTGPFLDAWLRDLMTTDQYGALPAHVVVVLAGQQPLDAVRWSGWADFVADLPLAPFDETEARGLLAAKGVTDETVVAEVLRLSAGLPVLLSTLAENQPGSADDVGDPSATAVERFLKWEPDPVRRAAALACALPRRLDEDVFRAAVDEAAAGLYGWLCTLPFVTVRGSRVQYHDIVRDPMLRVQRQQSRRELTARHTRLAAAFGAWRAEAAQGVADPDEAWERADWRDYRLEETYHLLCARPKAELPAALRETAQACRRGPAVARRWARMLADAGDAVDDADLRQWGRELVDALGDDTDAAAADPQRGAPPGGPTRVAAALRALLSRPGLDAAGRAVAHAARGRELFTAGDRAAALAEYGRAIACDPDLARAHYERGLVHMAGGGYRTALYDLDRADELAPGTPWVLASRGEARRMSGLRAEAVADLDRAIALQPTEPAGYASRGACHAESGRHEAALADFDRALELDPDHRFALVRRARVRRARKEWDAAFADLDRAVRGAPDSAWLASERGDAYRLAGRYEEAVAELGRALSLDPDHVSARAGRGAALAHLGRVREAMDDLHEAIRARPNYAWALVQRGQLRLAQGDETGARYDLERAVAADPDVLWVVAARARAYRLIGRHAEALAEFDRVLADVPDYTWALFERGLVHRARHDHPAALADLDRVVELDHDHGPALRERVRTWRAMGRTGEALGELERMAAATAGPVAGQIAGPGVGGGAATGSDAEWAIVAAADLLVRCGDGEEALRRLADGPECAAADRVRSRAHRHAGRRTAARHFAERACARDPRSGRYPLALAVSEIEGSSAAVALWRWIWDDTAEPCADEWVRAVAGYALDDWPGADHHMGALLAAPDWGALARLSDDLTVLLRCPGGDPLRLVPRLARVAAARDAVRARYAARRP